MARCGHKRRFVPTLTMSVGMRWWRCPVEDCTHGNWRALYHDPPGGVVQTTIATPKAVTR